MDVEFRPRIQEVVRLIDNVVSKAAADGLVSLTGKSKLLEYPRSSRIRPCYEGEGNQGGGPVAGNDVSIRGCYVDIILEEWDGSVSKGARSTLERAD